jgi:glycosyltransferase involved in cell wall biosynthesis
MSNPSTGKTRPKYICIALMDDPVYKQSSLRVADTLAGAGHAVTMIGRRMGPGATADAGRNGEPDAGAGTVRQVRFACLFKKGKASYAEMNIRIFFYLLFHRVDLVCAVNLDAILPCYLVSILKGIPRLYDARELFTEMAEVVARPRVRKVWLWVERTMVPRFPRGYAVCLGIAEELHRRYGVCYSVIRNMTVLEEDPVPGGRPPGVASDEGRPTEGTCPVEGPYLLYQGAVNHGRGLDGLMGAMRHIDLPLIICGTGNYMNQTKEWVRRYGLEKKVVFTGQLKPKELRRYTDHAYIGINLVEREGFNQYHSLPNKLFDYIHSGVPQVTMDYPEYRRVQDEVEVAVLIPDVTEEEIVQAVRRLCGEAALYGRLRENCAKARHIYNWQAEERKLFESNLYIF